MKTFRNRVFILILIPTILIFLAFTLSGTFYFNSILKDQAIIKKQYELELTSRAVDDWLISRLSDLVLLSRSQKTIDINSAGIKKVLMDEQLRLSFLYDKFWIIKPSGEYWNTEGELSNIKGHPILRSFATGKKFLNYYIPKSNDSVFGRSIILAVSIYEGDKLKVYLCASVPFEWFNLVIRYFTSNFFNEVYVVDTHGTILSHNRTEVIGKKEHDVYDRILSVNTELEDAHAFVLPLKVEWKIVGVIQKEILFEQIDKIRQYVSILIMSFLFVIALITFGITRIVVNPIRVLTEGVKRVMQGDYGQKIDIKSTNEINILADTFNKMNQKLSKSRTDDRFVFLGHISARMAHEIRKPMNIIQLIAEAVKKRGEFREEDYRAIVQEIENADKFVKEIFDFVKPEDLSLSLYSIQSMVIKVVQKFELKLRKKNIQIETDFQENIPNFYMDIFRMEQVISNVINNSIQAIEQDGQIAISLQHKPEKSQVVLKIMDSGPGIPQDIIDKIFDPYFSTKSGGIGIGLSISYRILMSHGAKIEASNLEKGGAVMQITFDNID